MNFVFFQQNLWILLNYIGNFQIMHMEETNKSHLAFSESKVKIGAIFN